MTPAALKTQALAFIQNNRPAEAERCYRQALALAPDDHEAHFGLANLLLNLGRDQEAAGCYQQAIHCQPTHAETYNNQGVALNNLGRYDDAVASYRLALDLKPDYALAWNNLGNSLAALKQWAKAEAAFNRALALKTDLASAHYNLANVLVEQQRWADAEAAYRRAIKHRSDYAAAFNNLGNLLLNRKRYDEAIPALRQALRYNPQHAGAYNNLGLTLFRKGEAEKAVEHIQTALRLQPNFAEAYCSLGIIHNEELRHADAVAAYRAALRIQPEHAEAHCGLGNALASLGNDEEAAHEYHEALCCKPDYPEALSNLGILFDTANKMDEAADCHRRALALNPELANVHTLLGNTLARQGKLEQAAESYRQALALAPGDGIRIKLAIMLPPILHSHAHIEEVRAGLEKNLDALSNGATSRTLHPLSPRGEAERGDTGKPPMSPSPQPSPIMGVGFFCEDVSPPSPLGGVGRGRGGSVREHEGVDRDAPSTFAPKVAPFDVRASSPLRLIEPDKEIGNANFFLAYHGLNNRDLQTKLARLYEAACPELLWTAPHCLEKRPRSGPIKIGFISKFMHNHSIGKTTSGLLAELSRDRFRVYALFIPPVVDDELSRFIRAKADETHILSLSLAAARRKIAELELDILFYQDIGMEVFGYFLAFARLAPVQCVTFGHPDTTGIRNMDYWVSNDLFEPDDAQAHYSEKLFLLHDLGTLAYYYRPKLPSPAKTRADFKLPEDATLYLCPQTLFKFHPDFDAILDGILRADPRARVVLIQAKIPYWVELLKNRFAQTFPELLDRVLFVPQQNSRDFIGLLALADVILDTPHFNGMNTSLEAFSVGTPVVTWPRALQRGRHTYGMYRKMNMDECIAQSADDYVAIAVRLGTDRAFRTEVREKILTRNTVLYEDKRVISEFQRFFHEALRSL